MIKTFARRMACIVAIAGGLSAPLLAQQAREPIPNVKKTPLTYCQPSSTKFIRHTRKGLKYPGQKYCREAGWNVFAVEHDGKSVYWRVPFGTKPRPGDPYGPGDVYCMCRKL
jgi:hypothetical protein